MEAEPTQLEPELTASPAAATHTASLFVGIPGMIDPEQLRSRADALRASGRWEGVHLTLAYPGAESTRTPIDAGCDLLSYPLPSGEGISSPWAHVAAAQAELLGVAVEQHPQAIVLLHPDLDALEPFALEALAAPVLARQADLVMATYAQGPFDSLLNNSILAPLTRALYGKHVRFPLAPDFALSTRVAARLRMRANSGSGIAPSTVLWPTTVAAGMDAVVTEVSLAMHHPAPPGEVDLSSVIAQLVGSVFAEMEVHAPLWQRVRAGQPPALHASATGTAAAAGTGSLAPLGSSGIDTAPMIKSFLLGSRSLQDVWGMVLPPITLLDLKRITLMPADKFRLPDELWVRILYDFALGYRLRTINRTHLLGALTPLYLGWVASYVQEAGIDPSFSAPARMERLARSFEEGKPYLVRRWRWPDRFNP